MPEEESQDVPASDELSLMCSTPFKMPLACGRSFVHPQNGIISPIKLSDSSSSDSDSSDSFCASISISDQDNISSSSDQDSCSDIDDSMVKCCLDDSNTCDETVECGTVEEDTEDTEPLSALARATLLNNVKLHNHSDLSVNEGILEIMELFVKNKESKRGLHRSIQAFRKLLPDGHRLPSSSKKILSYIESLAPPVPASIHYYCQDCLYYHGLTRDGLCEICQKPTTFGRFYTYSVGAVMKYLLEFKNLATIIDLSEGKHNSDPTILTDLRDGQVFKSKNVTSSKYDLNAIVNGDGVRIRKGGKDELWLLMSTVAEVPIHLRKAFITILGIWYGPKKPDMKTFLKPYSEEMKILDSEGVQWIHPVTKESHRSIIRQPLVLADAPARAMFQNCMLFNSKYGCNLCEIKTKLTKAIPGKKRIRVYFYENDVQLRTRERMLAQAATVGGKDHVRGVKGPSVLDKIPSCDVAKCMVPEYMHSVLLGVMKQLLNIWTAKSGAWCIKNRVGDIDVRLKSVKHPDFVHRISRQLKSLKFWKASDLYYFLLFEGLPTLEGHLPLKYLQHFFLLVMGIFSLLRASIPLSDVPVADGMLKLFARDVEDLYSDRELTYNIHQLTHLAQTVLNFGPLFVQSAFPYEDMNGWIGNRTHGTNNVDTEIVNNVKICQGIQTLKSVVMGLGPQYNSNSSWSDGEFLGKEAIIDITPKETDALRDSTPKIFLRAKIGYDTFTSEGYKQLKTEDFYLKFSLNGQSKYGSIRYYAQTAFGRYICISLLSVDQTRVFFHPDIRKCVTHIVPFQRTDTFVTIALKDIVSSAVKVGRVMDYLYERPNLYRFVM